ncbi:MAG: hypothetical protein AAGJ29_06835 [Pseudomonadota bacterium]
MIRNAVLLAAVALIFAALYHLVLLIADPSWTAFAGAPPEIVDSLREGTWVAPVSIILIAGSLFVMAGFGLAAAGVIPRWPLQRLALSLIAGIFLLRGLAIVPQLMTADITQAFDLFHLFASALIIFIGSAYLLAAFKLPPRATG